MYKSYPVRTQRPEPTRPPVPDSARNVAQGPA